MSVPGAKSSLGFPARLGGVLELPVTSASRDEIPTVFVQHPQNLADLFGSTTTRVRLLSADVDMPDRTLLDIHSLGPDMGWWRVPTPMF